MRTLKFTLALVGWLFFWLIVLSWAQGGLHFAINGHQLLP